MHVGQVADDLVGAQLHPGLESVGAVQLVGLVGVQYLDASLDGGTGLEAPRDLLHLCVQVGHLLLTPAIGLL